MKIRLIKKVVEVTLDLTTNEANLIYTGLKICLATNINQRDDLTDKEFQSLELITKGMENCIEQAKKEAV